MTVESNGYKPLHDNAQSQGSVEESDGLFEPFDLDDSGVLELPRWQQTGLTNQMAHGQRSNFQRLVSWIDGPSPTQTQSINPWFPKVQELPLRFVEFLAPERGKKIGVFLIFLSLYIGIWTPLLWKHWQPGTLNGQDPLERIDCTGTFWHPRNECGLDGIDCRPFTNSSLAFRCPAGCASVQVLNPRAVGAEEIIYQPLVIGGPVYRGDSFVCAAAMHAGLVSDVHGGCGRVSRIGSQSSFPSSENNGIASVSFNSSFPLSMVFEEGTCEMTDLRWDLLTFSVFFTTVLSLCSTSAPLLFFTAFSVAFFQTGLVSDPSTETYFTEVLSDVAGKFLPAAFCMYVLYRYCVRLHGISAQIEKTLLWLGPLWIGALSNMTIERWLPIQRLTPHDIEQQSGAKAALATIVVLIACIVFQQIYYFRLEGRLLRYLVVYLLFIVLIVAFIMIPGLEFRLHHYILALLLLPGTSLQTRPSLVYQGLLLGLFINGIARWGFDSVLQTTDALREDGRLGSILPDIDIPLAATASSLTLAFTIPLNVLVWTGNSLRIVDGVSVLVNDVERYRHVTNQRLPMNFTWHRGVQEPQYFRLAYMAEGATLDYTAASIWHPNGTWETKDREGI